VNNKSKLSKVITVNSAFWFLVLVTLAVSLQQYFLPDRQFWDAMRPQYNNFLIFKFSFQHLVDGLNLYDFYPEEHGDLFKYSPTFAIFMGLFYYLPDWLGLTLWSLLNTLTLYFGIRFLPKLKDEKKVFILLFVLLELIGNLQNEQSNALMAGLLLLTFVSFERKNLFLAAMFIALGTYIKLFGILGAGLFLLYPNKARFIGYSFFWFILLFLLPLLVISPEQLINQYSEWFRVINEDHASRYGFSVLGILHKWFGLNPSKFLVLITGCILFCLPFIRTNLYKIYQFRLLFLASVLIWVILFNHTAESSGYILAMTGAAIWYFSQKPTKIDTLLILLTFAVVSLFSTDLMPTHIRNDFIYPYYFRTIPVLIIWIKLVTELLFKPISETTKN